MLLLGLGLEAAVHGRVLWATKLPLAALLVAALLPRRPTPGA
jgi:hypothetical protein